MMVGFGVAFFYVDSIGNKWVLCVVCMHWWA